jgi:hypothetical protein
LRLQKHFPDAEELKSYMAEYADELPLTPQPWKTGRLWRGRTAAGYEGLGASIWRQRAAQALPR